MKTYKKLLSYVLVAVLLSTTILIVNATQTSSHVENFDPQFRLWHYGGYPDKVTYSSGGYITLESTHYAQQHQVCFYGQAFNDQWKKTIEQAIAKNGLLAYDVYVKDCYGTNADANTPDNSGYQQNPPALNIIVKYNYVDNSGESFKNVTMINNETGVGAVGIGETRNYRIDVSEFENYKSFEITFVKVAVMNYANTKNSKGEQGCGDFSVRFSPFYVSGDTAPDIGDDLGENFDESLYSWESLENVTSDEPGSLTPDGPFNGGVDLKRDVNNKFYPYLADGKTIATTKPTVTQATTPTATQATTQMLVTPTTPTIKNVKLLTKTSAKIKWSAAKNATQYQVYRAVGNGAFTLISTTKSTSFISKKLAKGTKYRYKLKALNSTKAGSFSKTVSITTMNYSAKAKLALKAGKKKLTVTRKSSILGATGYQIQYSLNSKFNTAKKYKTKTTTISKTKTLSKLTSNKVYYVRVRAHNKVNGKTTYGAWSSASKIRVK